MSTRRARARSLLALAVVAVAVAAVLGATASAAGTPMHRSLVSCRRGSVPARIGGKRVCLRAGQRCKKRYERQYRRHGFHCQAGGPESGPNNRPPPPPPRPPPPPLTAAAGRHPLARLP